MINIRLAGGLGNQILQLAAAITYSIDQKKQIAIYADSISKYKTKRAFKLSFLGYSEYNKFSNLDKFILKYRVTHFLNYFKDNYITDRTTKNLIIKKHKNYFLDGYFHNINYTYKGIEFLKKKFKNLDIDTSRYNIDFENDVAVHIRRGDYLTEKNMNIYNILKKSYYINSLKKIDYHKIYIFSTEPIDFALDDNQIEIFNYNLNDIEEFILMSKFKKIIISNSTFSFCAAIFSSHSNKQIIAPSTYYLNDDVNNKLWYNNFNKLNFIINDEI